MKLQKKKKTILAFILYELNQTGFDWKFRSQLRNNFLHIVTIGVATCKLKFFFVTAETRRL